MTVTDWCSVVTASLSLSAHARLSLRAQGLKKTLSRKGRRRPTCPLYKNKPAGFTQQNHPESLHRAVTHNTDKHNHVSLQPKPPWTTVALSRPHALLFLKVMKRGGQSAAIRAD